MLPLTLKKTKRNVAACVAALGLVWHSLASPVELFFRKQLHEQLHEQGRAMFWQLHHVLNSVRVSFQRS
jgi:hypothetical protein